MFFHIINIALDPSLEEELYASLEAFTAYLHPSDLIKLEDVTFSLTI